MPAETAPDATWDRLWELGQTVAFPAVRHLPALYSMEGVLYSPGEFLALCECHVGNEEHLAHLSGAELLFFQEEDDLEEQPRPENDPRQLTLF